MNVQKTEAFQWELYSDGYAGGSKLVPNHLIKGTTNKVKCFSREPYAQDLFDFYAGQDVTVIRKDLTAGDIVKVKDIYNVRQHYIDVELSGGLTITIDIAREKRFIQIYGYDSVSKFMNEIKHKDIINQFLDKGIYVYVVESSPTIKISLWQGYQYGIRNEFIRQINNPTQAYVAKVIEANRGGFFVDVQGIEAFMPGSLAAANKIDDFMSYVGKEVIVMIEDYLSDMNSFIVSHKKYINHILPSKIQQLDTSKQYTGTVTGCSKYGIFLEFEEIFTGLLHVSKMDEELSSIFKKRQVKTGTELTFYIDEILKDNRIVLTAECPEEKNRRMNDFLLENDNKIIEATVAAIMNFGLIVNVGDVSGLVPNKFMRDTSAKSYRINDKIFVVINEFKDDRILFKCAPAEIR